MDIKTNEVELSGVKTYNIEDFDQRNVALAVQSGVGHRLNNALTPLTFFDFMENDRADKLKETIMLVGGYQNLQVDSIDFSEERDTEALHGVARSACRHYADQYIEKMRQAGFEGDDEREILKSWEVNVESQYQELGNAIGEEDEDLKSTRRSWQRIVKIVEDIVNIAYGEVDLPPIYNYDDTSRYFFDFGRFES